MASLFQFSCAHRLRRRALYTTNNNIRVSILVCAQVALIWGILILYNFNSHVRTDCIPISWSQEDGKLISILMCAQIAFAMAVKPLIPILMYAQVASNHYLLLYRIQMDFNSHVRTGRISGFQHLQKAIRIF